MTSSCTCNYGSIGTGNYMHSVGTCTGMALVQLSRSVPWSYSIQLQLLRVVTLPSSDPWVRAASLMENHWH